MAEENEIFGGSETKVTYIKATEKLTRSSRHAKEGTKVAEIRGSARSAEEDVRELEKWKYSDSIRCLANVRSTRRQVPKKEKAHENIERTCRSQSCVERPRFP